MKKRKPNVALKSAWGIRLKLWAEGNKLRAECDRLRAEGNKLRAEGAKLRAEGAKLWAEAILKAHGNIKVEWKAWNHCVLETGEEFKGE
jgi:hypothetical protein